MDKTGGKQMTFHSINGLIESKTFQDFWQHIAKHPTQMQCPICGEQCYRAKAWVGFNMNQAGSITFKCTNPNCDFNKMEFTIKANPHKEE